MSADRIRRAQTRSHYSEYNAVLRYFRPESTATVTTVQSGSVCARFYSSLTRSGGVVRVIIRGHVVLFVSAMEYIVSCRAIRNPRVSYLVFLILVVLCSNPAAQPTWVTTTIDSAGTVGYSASIAVGSDGYPQIAYLHSLGASNKDLKYARATPGGWETEIVEGTVYWASRADLVLDSSGNPGIGYTGGDANYTVRSGAGHWTSELIGSPGYGAWQVAVAMDDQDVPHAVYNWTVPKYYTGFTYGKKEVSGWTEELFDNSTYYPTDASFGLAIEPGGAVHVCLTRTNMDPLRYFSCESGVWSSVEFGAGRWSSIVLDDLNSPLISYYDPGAQDLVLMEQFGSVWAPAVIDAHGDVGQYTAMAIDSGGIPHVVYYDATRGALKYAVRSGPARSWQIYTVDDVGDVGWWASLALDTNDKPHIAYYDITNRDLKYATVDPNVPTERRSWGSIKNQFR